ncbi:unnamed protein product [Orchesella dallaii]|uniref:Uncharacterized protein n=1 Tax=Orchesella dallaii TaxID=48710 RepID=A0ABP1PK81_9HEXA
MSVNSSFPSSLILISIIVITFVFNNWAAASTEKFVMPSKGIMNVDQSVPDAVMIRYCSGYEPDQCDDLISRNAECRTFDRAYRTGYFDVLYPSNVCYLYSLSHCRGKGRSPPFNKVISMQKGMDGIVSYVCFK